jgi:hypothetical protein
MYYIQALFERASDILSIGNAPYDNGIIYPFY